MGRLKDMVNEIMGRMVDAAFGGHIDKYTADAIKRDREIQTELKKSKLEIEQRIINMKKRFAEYGVGEDEVDDIINDFYNR